MKYIDADLLRKEVEKRMHICNGIFERDSDIYFQGKAIAYKETLSFLSTLESEKPTTAEGLEEELDKFYGMYRKDGKTYDITSNEEVSDWKENGNFLFEIEFARHFAQWGAEHLKK